VRIAVTRERGVGERRVAISPEAAKVLVAAGHDVVVESGAGSAAGMDDADYGSAGATIAPDRAATVGSEGLVVSVQGPTDSDALAGFTEDHVVVGLLDPVWNPEAAKSVAATGATSYSLDLVPRSTRAQSMDVLSSTATVAGTQAVLTAAYRLPKLMPLMITAAGTIPPARLVVLGAGVAGLQAIATARRLGAVVEGFDIREEALEQIRSVGAKSISVPPAEDGVDPAAHTQAALTPHLAEADIVITAAQIPGRRSPILVTETMVDAMKSGAMIIDLAAIRGGNCELTRADEEVAHNGVSILGPTDLASGSAFSASRMFANNVVKLIELILTDDGTINLDTDDDIIAAMLVTTGGQVVHPQVIEAGGPQ
jgi:NAD(P) transhydrogenase subunit alpha|tara:strand:- start:911 stop:2017 length:1107 start_codon:yes stop_codon:yes gene_type:complete